MAAADRRDQWRRIAMKSTDRDFVLYDVKKNTPHRRHVNFNVRVRGRSLAELMMAYLDFLQDEPYGFAAHSALYIYDYFHWRLPNDDLEAEELIGHFFESDTPFPVVPFYFKPADTTEKETLVVRDMPGIAGRNTKPAREPE